jgi:hypothetical protein
MEMLPIVSTYFVCADSEHRSQMRNFYQPLCSARDLPLQAKRFAAHAPITRTRAIVFTFVDGLVKNDHYMVNDFLRLAMFIKQEYNDGQRSSSDINAKPIAHIPSLIVLL